MAKYDKLTIKNWAVDDRPREKLINKGIQSLSDAELLAILIGSGNKNQSAVELCKHILNTVDNNLNELGKKNVRDLTKIRGIGPAKAISIIAALELGKRRKMGEITERKKIVTSNDAFEYFQAFLTDLPHEEFYVLLLDRANHIIEKQQISRGGVAGTVIDVKIILKHAIEKLASSVILAHNHPSGNLIPSQADINITNKMAESGKIMDIMVLDHIIIADEKYYSFADEGKL